MIMWTFIPVIVVLKSVSWKCCEQTRSIGPGVHSLPVSGSIRRTATHHYCLRWISLGNKWPPFLFLHPGTQQYCGISDKHVYNRKISNVCIGRQRTLHCCYAHFHPSDIKRPAESAECPFPIGTHLSQTVALTPSLPADTWSTGVCVPQCYSPKFQTEGRCPTLYYYRSNHSLAHDLSSTLFEH